MDSKLMKAGAAVAKVVDHSVHGTKHAVQSTKRGFSDFVLGYQRQRLADQAKRATLVIA